MFLDLYLRRLEHPAYIRKDIGSSPIRSMDSGTVLRSCSTSKPMHPLEEIPRSSLTSNGKVWLFGYQKTWRLYFFDGYTVSGSGTDCKTVAFGFGWFDSISIDLCMMIYMDSLYGNTSYQWRDWLLTERLMVEDISLIFYHLFPFFSIFHA